MAQSDLPALLSRLRADLKRAQTADPTSRRLLQELSDELRSFVDQDSTKTTDDYRALKDRLTGAVALFEGSHPELTRSIEALVDTLGQHTL